MKNYQSNGFSKTIYEGGRNQAELIAYKIKQGFKSNQWITFLQARELGRKIKKGSVGVSIFKGYGEFDAKDKDGNYKTESRPIGFARVFNMDQTEKY